MPRQIVRLLLAVLILASLFGGRSLVANVTDGSQHVVKPGETLSGIAAQYGLTVEQLASLNGLADPDRLAEGQTLKLPTTARSGGAPAGGSPAGQAAGQPPATIPAQAPARAGSTSEYVVQPGDTLSGIAKALGVTLKALLEANDLDNPDRLTVGQKVNVPAGAAPLTPPAVPSARSNQPGAPPASVTAPAVAGPNAATAPGQGAPAAAAQPAPAADDPGALLDRLAQQYGVDPSLVRALAWIETNGKPQRLDQPGSAGHLAVTEKTFEFVQQTLVKRPLDRANPVDNLEAGVAYVASMLKWGGDDLRGLAAFLQGPGSVRSNGVRPAIEEQVKRILALRDRIKQGLPAGPATAGPASGAGQGAATASQPKPSASPEGKPSPGEAAASLAARVVGAARAVAGQEARIGVSGRDFMTGQRLSLAGDQSFPAASVGKLALLVEVYRQSFGGAITLTETQRADLRAMIVSSDNDAANRLMELLTVRAVNANLQAIGLASTRLANPFGLASAAGSPANVSTPDDMTRLLELLVTEQLVSAQASREMRGLLLEAQDGSKLRRGLPPEARLAHKSGWYDGVANDVGIITHPQGTYVLSVFTEGIANGEVANQTIAAISEIVYSAWGPKDGPSVATRLAASR